MTNKVIDIPTTCEYSMTVQNTTPRIKGINGKPDELCDDELVIHITDEYEYETFVSINIESAKKLIRYIEEVVIKSDDKSKPEIMSFNLN